LVFTLTQRLHIVRIPAAFKVAVCVFLLVLFSNVALAQNTKGDKPQRNQKQVRETKSKSVKRKEKSNTRDIAGRRLRTRDKSSANRANANYPQPSPYPGRTGASKDRAASPRGKIFNRSPRERYVRGWTGDISGHPIRKVKPSKSGVARNNVYPQFKSHANHPSRKPHNPDDKRVYGHTPKGVAIVKRFPQNVQRPWKGNIRGGRIGSPSASGSVRNIFNQRGPYMGKGRIPSDKPYTTGFFLLRSDPGPRRRYSISPKSASRAFVKRGRKDVYWGKFSKGERPFTRDLSGNALRVRNFKSMPAGLVGQDSLKMFGRKPGGDRSYQGRKRGYKSKTPFFKLAWQGDVSGKRIRSPRATGGRDRANRSRFRGVASISGNVNSSKSRGGYSTRSNMARDNSRLPVRTPGIGGAGINKSLAKLKGRKPILGGGSKTRGWNNKGQPVDVNGAGMGAIRASRFQGSFKRLRTERSGEIGKYSGKQRIWDLKPGMQDQGEGYTGNIKFRRPDRGGGSRTRGWNNKGQAVDVNNAGQGTVRASRFQGNFKKRSPDRSGEIGKYSGRQRIWDLKPGMQDQGEGYTGNIKFRRPDKGGGSRTRGWNNKGLPVDVNSAGQGTVRASRFQGNFKKKSLDRSREIGKYSGKQRIWDLKPGMQDQGEGYTGDIKFRRPDKGGGSRTRGWNNKGLPVDVNYAGQGTVRASRFQGNRKRQSPNRSREIGKYSGHQRIWDLKPGMQDQGEGYTGDIKFRRPDKGGGSRTRGWNNKGQPVDVNYAGQGTVRASRFQGNVKRKSIDRASGIERYSGHQRTWDLKPGMQDQGEGYTGDIKFRRPDKGGGSVSGRLWNNKEKAIFPQLPGLSSMQAWKFAGNMKTKRPDKGGGSISGMWNNNERAVDPREPGESSLKAGKFAGNMKTRRPDKGGGSISGLWNNNERAIDPREPGESSLKAGKFAGNMKTRRPDKGGGSISGMWNNNERAIDPREPGESSLKAGKFAGNMKTRRPDKGGGSISGMWNNNETPIEVRAPLAEDAKAANYRGRLKLRRNYIQNENAHDESMLKLKPDDRTYLASGLQIKIRRDKYSRNPKSSKEALPGIEPEEGTQRAADFGGRMKMRNHRHNPASDENALDVLAITRSGIKAGDFAGNMKIMHRRKHNPVSHEDALDGLPPTKSSIRAGEYSRNMKVLWDYKHNPNSAEGALDARSPGSSWSKSTTFAGRTRLTKSYRHNPRSAEEALKILAPGKAYAKIGDYQGNIKMHKFSDKRLHPDAEFAHSGRNNVKNERTIFMDVKLMWAKLFKKSDTQPENLKEKSQKLRHDKGEKGLWAGDPDYKR
jgi:hypothetical protein